MRTRSGVDVEVTFSEGFGGTFVGTCAVSVSGKTSLGRELSYVQGLGFLFEVDNREHPLAKVKFEQVSKNKVVAICYNREGVIDKKEIVYHVKDHAAVVEIEGERHECVYKDMLSLAVGEVGVYVDLSLKAKKIGNIDGVDVLYDEKNGGVAVEHVGDWSIFHKVRSTYFGYKRHDGFKNDQDALSYAKALIDYIDGRKSPLMFDEISGNCNGSAIFESENERYDVYVHPSAAYPAVRLYIEAYDKGDVFPYYSGWHTVDGRDPLEGVSEALRYAPVETNKIEMEKLINIIKETFHGYRYEYVPIKYKEYGPVYIRPINVNVLEKDVA